ncbi:alpha/beta hydrolase [Blastococcus sp. TF02-8]|uniref:alpha/beta fold hydrolase n=1 Tax=Blastococcus sp. TF02-8 TaxID=2250574 RepID=UPI000DEB9DC6|nr:alpha/beta hydrolase [Blastococcus sp. TF02-8]RBY97981.1 alpha/beta hydrolase [Blastococcus sp. TF02-8]
MTTFALIPGAGGDTWFWHRLVPELRQRGHTPVAVELPAGDDTAGLAAYTDAVVAAVRDHGPVTLVAQSMGGLTAPLVCARHPVEALVLLNAMVPRPGETGGEWWTATGQHAAQTAHLAALGLGQEPDDRTVYFHDVPDDVADQAMAQPLAQSGRPFADPWPLAAWPDVPTRVLAGRDDRLFPLEFQRRVAHDRLGLDVEELPGGHCLALGHPAELAEALTVPR